MAKGYNQFLEGISGKVGAIVVTTNRQQTVMRKRIYRNTSDSTSQRQIRANVSTLAHLWSTLNPTQILNWMTLGDQMSDKLGTRTLTSYQAFTSVNGLLLACGQPPVIAAPAAPTPPAALPPVLVTATLTTGVFALTLRSAAYPGLVQVWATAPASPGRHSFSRAAYKLIATLPALTPSSTDITAPYIARYGQPASGRKLALRLVPVSPAGFAGVPVEPSVIINAAAAAATLSTAETPAALKAA